MPIMIVEGPPGSGKSFSCVRRIVAALDAGKFVATNVELKPGWELRAARSNWIRRLVPGLVEKTAASYRKRTYISGSLDELMRVRMPGSKEGRGVMILDEAHNWCNARTWNAGGGDGKGRREDLVRFFSQHRKIGWDIYLITQRGENIDAQIRTLAEYRILLRNMRRFKVMGVPLMPFNFFLAIWTWEGGVGTIVKRESYLLNKRIAGLYDTLALSHGMEDLEADPIMLPLEPLRLVADAAEEDAAA
jgi:hypothetical protein